MKRVLFILCVCVSISLKAQDTSVVIPKLTISHVDLNYGYRIGFQNFYEQLNTNKSFKFDAPLQLIGLKMYGELSVHSLKKKLVINYAQILPQSIVIQDTLHGGIRGFVCGLGMGRSIESKHLDFNCYVGFNTGRLRVYGNELIRQKNPFFSPKIGIVPIVKLGKFRLSASIEYEYDVSKTTWRKTYFANSEKVALDHLRQSALTTQLGISYNFF